MTSEIPEEKQIRLDEDSFGILPDRSEFEVLRSNVSKWYSENPGVMATFGYLYLTTVGVVFYAIYYSLFGIHILDFAEPADFILAGVREPVLFVFSIVSLLSLRRLIRADRKWRRKSMKYRRVAERLEGHRFYSNWLIYPLVIIGYFVMFVTLYAEQKVTTVLEGKGNKVVIDLNQAIANSNTLGQDGSLVLIGTNSKFLFLYAPDDRHPSIVPLDAVTRITPYLEPKPPAATP